MVLSNAFRLPLEACESLYKTTVGSWRIGKITGKECIARIRFQYNLKESPDELLHRYLSAYGELSMVDGEMTQLIDTLRNTYRVSAFSNMVDLHAEFNESRGVFSHFDYIFVSCRTGCAKPDETAYAFVTNALKTEPGSCLFIDDLEENIQAAERFGMKIYHFDSQVGLEEYMRKEHIV